MTAAGDRTGAAPAWDVGPPAGARAGTILLLRHGRTALNARARLRGHIDEPLDDVGRAEVEALGSALAAEAVAAVISSPLQRALDTARAVAAHHDLEVEVDPGLLDRDWGSWAGRSLDELVAAHGTADAAPDVEGTAAFDERVGRAFARAAARASEAGHPVVVVAHDAVNRSILGHMTAGPPEALGQRTGCWNRLVRTPRGWVAEVIDAKPPA